MVKLATILALLASLMLMFSAPWLATLTYSIVSILQPQYVWFWAFDSFSVFKISAGITILAWIFHALQGNIDWRVYSSGQFKCVVVIMIIYHLSNLFTPFQTYYSLIGGDLVVSIFTTIAIMYFFVLGLLKNPQAIKYFAFIYIFVTVYYAYWANDHYLSGNWAQFTHGRLRGIVSGPYRDGNILSVVLTMGISFIMFGARYYKNTWVKVGLLATLPFIWHAIFLFASRGALLSAACVTLFFALVVKSRWLNIAMAAGFVVMLVWQGGTLTNRTSDTVNSSKGNNFELSAQEDKPINPRILSWQVGWGLALKYPILGAGPQRFQYASAKHYPNKSKHVAHNTFLNFSANTGLIAGFCYLLFFYYSYKQYRYVKANTETESIHNYINLSCMGALVGYFVGAVFLDLIIFEPFYFILILITANYWMVRREKEPVPSKSVSPVRAHHAL